MPTKTPIRKQRPRNTHRRPDTYQAAAEEIGLSTTHTFEVIHGTRETTGDKLNRLIAWAQSQASRGRSDSPAVATTLQNHAA